MNQGIESLLDRGLSIQQFCKEYFNHVSELLSSLDTKAIAWFFDELQNARKKQNTIFFIGNGGSASTASHMANDLSLGLREDSRELPFKAMALTDNTAVLTACANDCGYDTIFVKQLKIHYRPGDKLVAISASGNSPNIVIAVKWVKQQGGRVVGITGFDGGKLKELSDILIHVNTPKGEYGPVEDIHMILSHMLYTWIWQKKRGTLLK